jgi:hydrogenase-4 component F
MESTRRVLATLLMLSPLAGAVVVWLPRWPRVRWPSAEKGDSFRDVATIVASLISLALTAVLASTYRGALDYQLTVVRFHIDALSIYFVLLVNVIALVASFYTRSSSERRVGERGRDTTLFYCLFNLFHFTMVLVPMVANLVVLWVAVELTTLTSTVLVASERRRETLEAAWKYIIITSTGIIFALLGTFFLASAIRSGSGVQTSMDWPDLVRIARAHKLDENLVRLSFLFILVGYGTKAGFAPMHTWLPDGHGEAPYPVSALLSGVLLKSALYAILRFYTITNDALGDRGLFASRILLGSGLLSLVVATPFIVKANPFKRVLAYHSLEHMGIITFGIGIGGPIALFGALLHALNHGVTKSLMFLAYGNVQENHRSSGQTDRSDAGSGLMDHRGVLQGMPWTGFMLAVGGLALVGSPPFNVFYSEFLILWAAVTRAVDQPTFALIAAIGLFLLSVTVIFGGLVRHLSRILMMGGAPERYEPEKVRQVVPLLALLVLVVLFGLTVPAFGPLDLRHLLNESVTIVCGDTGCP